MEERRTKIQICKEWIRNNMVTFFSILVPALTGLTTLLKGVYIKLYLQEYYKYFNIDFKYVSINNYWDLADVTVCFFFCALFAVAIVKAAQDSNEMEAKRLYYEKIKDDKSVCPRVKEYLERRLKKDIIKKFIAVFFTTFIVFAFAFSTAHEALHEQLVFFPGSNTAINFTYSIYAGAFAFFLAYLVCFPSYDNNNKTDSNTSSERESYIEGIYKKIFPTDDKSACFRKRQMEVLMEYYKCPDEEESDRKTLIVGVIILLFLLSLSMLSTLQAGHNDAMDQRMFLVTEDNEHIAIQVSEDRYALIEIKEENDCLILFMEKQNFHEINDFPCTRKTYREVKKVKMEDDLSYKALPWYY